jgi:alcohol dehydrogenase class IV
MVMTLNLRTTAFVGAGALEKMKQVAAEFAGKGLTKALIVTGKRSYKVSGAWDKLVPILNEAGIAYSHYDGVNSNPDITEVEEAVELAKKDGSQFVIGIGGGSIIDAAKTAAAMLANPDKTGIELVTGRYQPEKALPIVAISLTHGTGTEANHFAVCSVKAMRIKPGFIADCAYPKYAIVDAELMTTLSADQSRFTSLDAFCHAYESAVCTIATPLAVAYAHEVVRLVAEHLPVVEKDPNNLTSRHYLAYASLLGAQAFEQSSLHIGHVMEHQMSGVQTDLAHGKGLAIILKAFLKRSYRGKPAISAFVLSPIIPGLKGTADEADTAAEAMGRWLEQHGLRFAMADGGFTKEDVPMLAEKTMAMGGGFMGPFCPMPVTMETVSEMFLESF